MFIDHVAIRAQQPEISADWYEKVLLLKRHQFPEWGDYPIMMLDGEAGVAIFPANEAQPPHPPLRLAHYAFRVDKNEWDAALQRFKDLNIAHRFEDHYYFQSVYIQDPDGYSVELTLLVRPV